MSNKISTSFAFIAIIVVSTLLAWFIYSQFSSYYSAVIESDNSRGEVYWQMRNLTIEQRAAFINHEGQIK